MDERLLQEQVDYYRARAGEYDEWFFRTGRYDLGAARRLHPGWTIAAAPNFANSA